VSGETLAVSIPRASTGFTLWLTGLPSSGKNTLAEHVAARIRARGLPVEVIDSGKLRRGPLGATLGFTRGERDTNVRRHALAAQLLARNGVAAVVSAVSPYQSTRDEIRQHLRSFVEVYVATPREVCVQWDTTGNWARALAGEIQNFTGVDDPYEPPLRPDVRLDLSQVALERAVRLIIDKLELLGFVPEVTQELAGEDGELVGERLHELGYGE
jgi:adenylylsulfate kinase